MENTRDRLLAWESAMLSPYAQLSAHTKGRKQTEEDCPFRTCYQKDRDKILHCKSFRRLKQKTQVFISPEGDHYRTRLTHTLEVTQIARTICRTLRLNEDLCEAIAMGHDLGHTPFGHAGERALQQLNPKGFTHYEQSVRVVEYLENNLRGLNLCWEVIDGIKNHTHKGTPATLEGKVVQLSDRIAYINHDIEDAIAGGILKESDLPAQSTNILGHSKSQRITTLISSIANNSSQDILMDPLVQQAFLKLHQFMYDTVYTDSLAKIEEKKVDKLIGELYAYYKYYPEKMPQMYQLIAQKEGIDQGVTDYIQGMSDDFATQSFETIFVPKPWNVK